MTRYVAMNKAGGMQQVVVVDSGASGGGNQIAQR